MLLIAFLFSMSYDSRVAINSHADAKKEIRNNFSIETKMYAYGVWKTHCVLIH